MTTMWHMVLSYSTPGAHLGTYLAVDDISAIRQLDRDAGYLSSEDAAKVVGQTLEEHLDSIQRLELSEVLPTISYHNGLVTDLSERIVATSQLVQGTCPDGYEVEDGRLPNERT